MSIFFHPCPRNSSRQYVNFPQKLDVHLWIKIMWGACVCKVKYNSAIKQNEILLFMATWRDLEGIMISAIS